MSRYSDDMTVGGQVIAHRVRMMRQNWGVIWIVARVSFLLSFLGYIMCKYTIHSIWNYLCIVKACYRDSMSSLPSSLFSNSYFWFTNGTWQEWSDYTIEPAGTF